MHAAFLPRMFLILVEYLTQVLPLEAMQGTVTATTVDESKYSHLPADANSPGRGSIHPAGIGKVHSKVTVTLLPAATNCPRQQRDWLVRIHCAN